jgi:hypothetical protein
VHVEGSGSQGIVVVVILLVVLLVVVVDVVVGGRQMPFGRFPGGLLLTHNSPRQQLEVVAHSTPGVLHGPACVVAAAVMMASAMANTMFRTCLFILVTPLGRELLRIRLSPSMTNSSEQTSTSRGPPRRQVGGAVVTILDVADDQLLASASSKCRSPGGVPGGGVRARLEGEALDLYRTCTAGSRHHCAGPGGMMIVADAVARAHGALVAARGSTTFSPRRALEVPATSNVIESLFATVRCVSGSRRAPGHGRVPDGHKPRLCPTVPRVPNQGGLCDRLSSEIDDQVFSFRFSS